MIQNGTKDLKKGFILLSIGHNAQGLVLYTYLYYSNGELEVDFIVALSRCLRKFNIFAGIVLQSIHTCPRARVTWKV